MNTDLRYRLRVYAFGLVLGLAWLGFLVLVADDLPKF